MKEKNKRKEETVRIVKVKTNRGGGEGKEGYQILLTAPGEARTSV